MKPLGIDLARLIDAKGDLARTPFIEPACPGARVYITKHDLETMVRGGETFIEAETHVPKDGYGHARVRCGRPIQRELGCAGHVVYYGLCESCSGLEGDNRATLRDRQKPAPKGDR